MEYDVIIVGAGASGLMAAIAAARQGSTVLVIDQKDKAGKKILATGNGKCNFTNKIQTPACYHSDDSAFAMKVLSCFDVPSTLRFFTELGILPKEREGYYYPNSEQAVSVVAVLLMECERLKVTFRYNEAVKEIEKPNYTVFTEAIPLKDEYKKTINSKEKMVRLQNNEKEAVTYHRYYGAKLILATGGCASPKLGSDGSGYRLAKGFGHNLIKPLPALVSLKSPEKYCRTVSGVRVTAVVNVSIEHKQIATEKGEILFTDYGISGIPILQISRYVAKALDHEDKVQLLLDYLPDISKEELRDLLKIRLQLNPSKTLEEMMVGLLNHKLSYLIIKEAKLDPVKHSKLITNQELEQLTRNIKEFRMQIKDTNSFENAQVCAGGVSTQEIDENSMESKRSKGLYLVGELVDVDGTCGGYNLQWAWSSGYLAGDHAGRKRDRKI